MVDDSRISRVSSRIVRGIFFHEFQALLPVEYESLGLLYQDDAGPLIETWLGDVKFPAVRCVQEGVFHYTII